jgi:stage IV sporulation protein FB
VNPNGPFDLHWRIFGIDFRVKPGFWLVNLLFGYFYVKIFRDVDKNLFAYLGLWLACAFVSILVHELGHVIMGRLFGAHSNIVLQAMGGAAIGDFPRLRPWQRILVSAAGPALGLAFFAFVNYGLSPYASKLDLQMGWGEWGRVVAGRMFLPFIEEGVGFRPPGMLLIMNLIWNLFNLIPIIPLDGGMIMREVVCIIIPRHGLRLAYGFSFLLAGSVTAYSIMKFMRPNLPYPPLDPLFSAVMFGLMAYGSFTGLMSAGGTPESQPDDAPVVRRATGYEEKDW